MSKKWYTAEEAVELLTADNDRDGNDLESSSEDDLHLLTKMKINQFYQTLTLMMLKLAWLAASQSLRMTMNSAIVLQPIIIIKFATTQWNGKETYLPSEVDHLA